MKLVSDINLDDRVVSNVVKIAEVSDEVETVLYGELVVLSEYAIVASDS